MDEDRETKRLHSEPPVEAFHPADRMLRMTQVAVDQAADAVFWMIEDERRVLDVVQRVLAGRGYEVLTATRPEQAEALSAKMGGGVSLLVTDLVMPGFGGRRLYAKLRQCNHELEVLYMSGYPERAASLDERRNPDDPYLPKPFGPEELARAVRGLLDT